MSTTLSTRGLNFFKARSVNATDTSFPAKIPTTTEPQNDAGTATGASVIDVGGKDGSTAPAGLLVVPYGLGANNDGFSVRVIGWSRVKDRSTSNLLDLWVPVRLCEVACLMGTAVGIVGSAVLATEAFCDTLTLVTNMGTQGTNVDVVSPQDNSVGHFLVSLKGVQKVELVFDNTTNTPSMNALLAFV